MRRRFFSCKGEALEVRNLLSAAAPEALGAIVSDEAAVVETLASEAKLVDHGNSISYSGGVTVTPTEIRTHADTIPRFVAQPTISTVRSGLWTDPQIWSGNRVPTDNDLVLIQPGTLVIYSTRSDTHIEAIEVGGRLTFATNVDTRLVVGTLTVMPTGTLQIGSQAVPIASQVTAEIVIADQPLDLANDPRQFGTGLLAFGKVSMFGSELNWTWTRLSAEPLAGDSTLLVENVDAGWKAGDTLVLTDTRQGTWYDRQSYVDGNLPGHWEEVTIDRVIGNRVYLTEPLAFDHFGARDAAGELTLLPHVALLDRNIVVRSENPQGTRGHVLFSARADVDIEYARFQDLGRTDGFLDLDNTTFDAAGNVTHIGTNQIARYAVHMHHLFGPENPTNTGYQFKLVGNTVDGSRRWAVDVHGSNYGLIEKNVVYDAQGAGFVTENGSEVHNVFRNNIAMRVVGTMRDGDSGTETNDYGRGGNGFWFRRGGNSIIGNVAASNSYAGFVIDGYSDYGPVQLPLFRGAMPMRIGEGYSSSLNPFTFAINNEAYGLSAYGLWAAYTSGYNTLPNQPTTLFSSLRLWHVFTAGVLMYHTSNVTFSNLTIYGDWSAQTRNDTGPVGVRLSVYDNRYTVIRNARIENFWIGIMAPRADASQAGRDRPTLIENSVLHNYVNILVSPTWDAGGTDASVLVVRNVKFDLRTDVPGGPKNPAETMQPANIRMDLHSAFADLTELSAVKVYSYNQVAGDDFQVFYREQALGAIVPQTDSGSLKGNDPAPIGSPQFGLTNLQNWFRYGIAIAGAIATGNTTRPGIYGLVGPIANSAITPRVVLVTPWNNAEIGEGSSVRIRYNVQGNLPDGYSVWLAIDDNQPFNSFSSGGPYLLPLGVHTLRGWIGDAAGRQLTGSVSTSAVFYVIRSMRREVAASSIESQNALVSALAAVGDEQQLGASPGLPGGTLIAGSTSVDRPTIAALRSRTLYDEASHVASLARRASVPDTTLADDDELISRLATAIVERES